MTNTDTAGSDFLRLSSTFTVRHRTSENVDADAHQKNAKTLILAWCLQQVVAQFLNANVISDTKCDPQRHCEFASQPGSRWIVPFLDGIANFQHVFITCANTTGEHVFVYICLRCSPEAYICQMIANKRRAISAIRSALAAGSLQLPPPKHAETCCQIAYSLRNIQVLLSCCSASAQLLLSRCSTVPELLLSCCSAAARLLCSCCAAAVQLLLNSCSELLLSWCSAAAQLLPSCCSAAAQLLPSCC